MELLAPAGGIEQLQAAIRFGADAVYLATERFGMRAQAANFTLADLPKAVGFAHAAKVKVYVACNVLMMPDDTRALPSYLRAVDAAGVDALIIGDLGAFSLAREYAPHVRLHISTQASVANAEAARIWYSLGARRIVCAREMSLADIARMRQDIPSDLELEAFVHGAQCMAVSGRCLISSYLTGRSGNKGLCAQPCRWSYKLKSEAADTQVQGIFAGADASAGVNAGAGASARVNAGADAGTGTGTDADADAGAIPFNPNPAAGADSDFRQTDFVLEEEKRPGQLFPIGQDGRGSFILNAKDLNMLEHLRKLEACGINAVKIEGRNKKAFYVATVVNAYRRVLDGEATGSMMPELYAISHRPYGTGFFFGPGEEAADFDGYEQECLHAADILACHSLPCTTDDSSQTDKSRRRSRQTMHDTPYTADGSSRIADEMALCETASMKESDGSQTSEPYADKRYCLTVRCRNRFAEGDKLEVLAPHSPICVIQVKNLNWLPQAQLQLQLQLQPQPLPQPLPTEETENDPSPASPSQPTAISPPTSPPSASPSQPTAVSPPASLSQPTAVPVANRTCDIYRFEACGLSEAVETGSFLRLRRYRRSARHP